jgi:23S rRNA pseudouridine2605 synthase
MRINQLLASATVLSRRSADQAVVDGRVEINGSPAALGQEVTEDDNISLDGQLLARRGLAYIVLNKPVGYIVSRAPQGNGKSVYDLLPGEYRHLNYVGRLDKDSSGLLLFTNDGVLTQELTHPSHQKTKAYQIELNKSLSPDHQLQLLAGVALDDGDSRFQTLDGNAKRWTLTMTEGRNRQIRRTFESLGYTVISLHRTSFGSLQLGDLAAGGIREVSRKELQ